MKRVLVTAVILLIVLILPDNTAWGKPGEEILKLGSRGEEVKILQDKLQQKGYYPRGEVSGYFGLNTLAAVVNFEKDNDLKADGKVSIDDWKILAPEILKPEKKVLGYYVQEGNYRSRHSLENNAQNIHFTAHFTHHLNRDGSLEGQAPDSGLQTARNNNIKPLLVVHNITNVIDSESVHQVLNSGTKRKLLVESIFQLLEKYNYAGVNIDFEGIYPGDRQEYNKLLEELNQALKPRDYLVTAAVPAKTSPGTSSLWNGAYDYKTIGQLVDYVVIMTYDEHWSGGEPGPVASLPWVKEVVKYTTSQISPGKILMGIPAYGYNWAAGSKTGVVLWKETDQLARYGRTKWHWYYKSPYINYIENNIKHQAWFENSRSITCKLDLVKKYNLAGIAVWRLGYADNVFWARIDEVLS